jgi:tetratricopeptide (TPR) repeat protein
MIKNIIPLLIACLLSGFVMSCSSSSPLVDEAESNLKNENYDAALAAANKSIQQNPQNALGYYYKGAALGQKGQAQESPSEAEQYYKQMKEAFEKAREVASNAEEAPDEIERIPAIVNSIWRTEHNTAYELATNDSLMQAKQNPLDLAVSHLNNATIIQPDSSLSFEVLAQVNNMREEYGEAAEAQERVIEINSNPQAKSYLVLAQYYRLDDQPKKAIEVLENAKEKFPSNTQLVEVLADSYSQMGESEKAIETVERLVGVDPENPQYRLSLGTQIYQSALELQSGYDENIDKIFDLQQKMRSAQGQQKEELQNELNSVKKENEELLQEINSLTDRAITELNATIKNRPDDPVAHNTLGIIYQNKAAVIFDKRNFANDSEEVKALDEQAKELLRKAMTHYEKAAELDPENQNYWRSLFQVYTALGMDEKAAEAEKKAGYQ